MEPFIGQISMFGGNFAPRGWALCDGQLLSIAQYSALFSLLGTMYGGDGRTNFGLPDLRGRSPVHTGGSAGPGLPSVRLGSKSGAPTTILTVQNLPTHTHNAVVTHDLRIGVTPEVAEEEEGADNTFGNGQFFSERNPTELMRPDTISGDVSVVNEPTGNGNSFNNYHPYQAINFIIALVGVFPSRN